MKRRNFIEGLLALPFAGKLLAKESESFAPPIEEVIDCLECYSNAADGYIRFSVPITRMNWEMKVHDYGAHTKKRRIFRNRWKGLKRRTKGEPGDARELLRRIKRHRK